MASRPRLEDFHFPYFAPDAELPAPLPTLEEILESTECYAQEESGRRVVRVGQHFMVKYGPHEDCCEAEKLLYLNRLGGVAAPKLYASYTTTLGGEVVDRQRSYPDITEEEEEEEDDDDDDEGEEVDEEDEDDNDVIEDGWYATTQSGERVGPIWPSVDYFPGVTEDEDGNYVVADNFSPYDWAHQEKTPEDEEPQITITIMEFIEGSTLDSLWDSFNEDKRKLVLRKVRSAIDDIRSKSVYWRRWGSFAHDVTPMENRYPCRPNEQDQRRIQQGCERVLRANKYCADCETEFHWRLASRHSVLYHGYLKPHHIIVRERTEEVVLVDWGNASLGKPEYEYIGGVAVLPGKQIPTYWEAAMREIFPEDVIMAELIDDLRPFRDGLED
ncbi:hypothetical protein F4780DRAFT_786587 [Xylariomycetidae sp. FL0641]|nr:hypothetical protein F4780DRAFT_786587 [Xylariomycetidae sp. FL0641]